MKDSFDKNDLIASGAGRLFGVDKPKLPTGRMLMFDRITQISQTGGAYEKGFIDAEFEIHPDLWFFNCHFKNDPVMPGCLGLDALWQLIGFYISWLGHPGKGRALGAGEIKFTGQVLPDIKLVRYHLDIKKVIESKLVMGVADGRVEADGENIYFCKALKVGAFLDKE